MAEVKKPLVSIIIPIYNKAEFIEQTIQSALNQTWKNIEIIIVDDESSDDSLSIVKKYENENIRVFNQPNSGASSARNLGLKKAKGDYIQFLDADDLLSLDKIEKQLKSLENKLDTVAVCSTVFFFDGDNHLLNSPAETELDFLFSTSDPLEFLINLYGGNGQASMVTIHSWLTPTQVIKKAGFWNETLSVDDDGEYFCRVVLASAGIEYAPAVFNYYRKFKNSSNLSSQTSFKAAQSAMLSIDLKYKHLFPLIENKLLNKIFCDMYWNCAVNLYPIHISLYKKIRKKIKHLGNYPPRKFYTHTKLYRFTTRYFGWKISAWISYIKLIVTQRI